MKAIFKNSRTGQSPGTAIFAGVFSLLIPGSVLPAHSQTSPDVPSIVNEAVKEIPAPAEEIRPAGSPEEIRPATPVEEVRVPALLTPGEPLTPADPVPTETPVPLIPDSGMLEPVPLPEPPPPPPLNSAVRDAPVTAVTELGAAAIESPLSIDTLSGPNDGATPSASAVAPWTLSLDTRAMYDDNIFLNNRGREGDFVFSISPAVQWRTGDAVVRKNSFADIKYRATGILFGRMSDENTVDHDARAAFNKRFGRGTLGVDAHYARRSDPTPDLGGRITRDEFSGIVSATVEFSDRTDIEAAAKVNSVRYTVPGWADYDEWVVETFAGYRPSGRTRLAVGVAAGRLNVKDQNSQNFTRALVRAATDMSGALTLRGTGGVEFRKTDRESRATPVFTLAADYKPRDGTTVTLEAFRDTTASGSMAGENQTRTGVALRVKQRVGPRLEAALEAGYERLAYRPTSMNPYSVDREDNYLYLRPSLRYEFREGRRAEIFYNFQQDESSVSEFSFEGNQLGVLIGVDF